MSDKDSESLSFTGCGHLFPVVTHNGESLRGEIKHPKLLVMFVLFPLVALLSVIMLKLITICITQSINNG